METDFMTLRTPILFRTALNNLAKANRTSRTRIVNDILADALMSRGAIDRSTVFAEQVVYSPIVRAV
jgi:hypothetical protein